jgi:hypothetical protein
MKVAVFPEYISQAGKSVWANFVSSIQKDGIEVVLNSYIADVAVIWSVLWQGRMKGNQQIYNLYRAQNKPVIVIEVGALNRNTTWKISVNGTDSNGLFWPRTAWNRDRKIEMLSKFTPTVRGSAILICGQNPRSHNWPTNISVEEWITNCVKELNAVTDRQIHIRPHPRYSLSLPAKLTPLVKNAVYTIGDDTDFSSKLNHYWAVINYNSYPGIQARLHGCNTVVNKTSLAAPVSHTDIRNIETPLDSPSEDWLDQIAHTEFYESEIEDGTAWRIIKPMLNI